MKIILSLLLLICVVGSGVVGGALAPPDMPVRNISRPFNNCGGNCPSNGCDQCPCGNDAQNVDVNTVCAGFNEWNQDQCKCIVKHESEGNAHAEHRNDDGTYDVGIWQINSNNWAQCNGGKAPCDEASNRACAVDIWRWGGNSFKLWATCSACGAC